MSAIAGYLGVPQPPGVLRAMSGRMRHRGPNAESFYEEGMVFVAAREGGSEGQLFRSDERGLAIVFSGEFHNLREERRALERRGVKIETSSPAETALRLYETYGIGCAARMRGGFVFAVHDQRKDLVFIARDATGAKPLYFATSQSGTFVFASEIKALFEHPSIQAVPDLRGVDAFLSYGYSPGPDSMFKGVHKLPPGHRIIWNPGLHVMIEPYWQWSGFAKPDPVLKTDEDFHQRFAALLEETVALQQEDGACGLVLTGSLESAAIAAAAAKGGGKVQAFCLDGERDGPAPATSVAQSLGFAGENVGFGAHDMDKLPEIVWALDEPVADMTLAPFYLAARHAQRRVPAIMAEAGAADLFLSQPAQRTLLRAREKPASYYSVLKYFYTALPQASLARAFGFTGRIGPHSKQRLADFILAMRDGQMHRQLHSLAAVFDARDKQALYLAELGHFMETHADLLKDPEGWPAGHMAQLLALQEAAALPDGALAPVEKLALFNSLECRMPFADRRLAEFLIGIPDHLRRGKALLRHYLSQARPELAAAPVPAPLPAPDLAGYLAENPLKDMVEGCLSESAVRRRGLFDWKEVRVLLAGAKTGEAVYARQVFALLNLEIWFRIFVDHEKGWISR